MLKVIKNRAANMSLMMHTKMGIDKKLILPFSLFSKNAKNKKRKERLREREREREREKSRRPKAKIYISLFFASKILVKLFRK